MGVLGYDVASCVMTRRKQGVSLALALWPNRASPTSLPNMAGGLCSSYLRVETRPPLHIKN